jgi:hypothetical protein
MYYSESMFDESPTGFKFRLNSKGGGSLQPPPAHRWATRRSPRRTAVAVAAGAMTAVAAPTLAVMAPDAEASAASAGTWRMVCASDHGRAGVLSTAPCSHADSCSKYACRVAPQIVASNTSRPATSSRTCVQQEPAECSVCMRQVRAETTVGGLNSRSYLEWDYEGFQASVRGDGRVGHDERSDSYAWLIPASRLSHDHLEEVRGHCY